MIGAALSGLTLLAITLGPPALILARDAREANRRNQGASE